MRNFNYVEQDGRGLLTFFVNNRAVDVPSDHVNFKKIRDGLVNDMGDDEMMELIKIVDKKETAVDLSKPKDVKLGKVEFVNGVLSYNGEPVECQGLVDRVLLLQSQGLPFDGMAMFIARLYENMSFRTRNELLAFIDRNGLTISADGYLLAYKAVQNNYLDKYSGTIDNSPGSVVEMPRHKVDDNFQKGCSKGLHAGALAYVYSYGSGNDRIVIVEIDPADVVSVPSDCNCQKLRICKYKVVSDYNGELEKVYYEENDYYLDEDEDEDEDTFDWESLSDEDEDDYDYDEDDSWDEGDVVSHNVEDPTPVVRHTKNDCGCGVYGTKPNGHRYHNRRDSHGRFC